MTRTLFSCCLLLISCIRKRPIPVWFCILAVGWNGWDLSAQNPRLVLPIEVGCQLYDLNPTKKLGISSAETRIYIWDSNKGFLLNTIELPKDKYGEKLLIKLSPDGDKILAVFKNGLLCLWDIKTGKELQRKRFTTGEIQCAAISPDFKFIAAGVQNDIRILAVNRFRKYRNLKGHTAEVTSLDFSDNGNYLASGSGDSTAILWNNNWKKKYSFTGHKARINHVGFSSDMSLITTASDDSTVRIWSTATGKMVRVIQTDVTYLTELCDPNCHFIGKALEREPAIEARLSADNKFILITTLVEPHVKGCRFIKLDSPDSSYKIFDNVPLRYASLSIQGNYLIGESWSENTFLFDFKNEKIKVHYNKEGKNAHVAYSNKLIIDEISNRVFHFDNYVEAHNMFSGDRLYIMGPMNGPIRHGAIDCVDENIFTLSGHFPWGKYGREDLNKWDLGTGNADTLSTLIWNGVWPDPESKFFFDNRKENILFRTLINSKDTDGFNRYYPVLNVLHLKDNSRREIHIPGADVENAKYGFSNNDSFLLYEYDPNSEDNHLLIYSARFPDFKSKVKLNDNFFDIEHVKFSPDGKQFIEKDKLYNQSGELLFNFRNEFGDHIAYNINCSDFSPDGKFIASANDVSITLWSRENLSARNHFYRKGHASIYSTDRYRFLKFTGDSKYILSQTEDATIMVWDIEKKKLKYTREKAQIVGRNQSFDVIAWQSNWDIEIVRIADGSILHRIVLDKTAENIIESFEFNKQEDRAVLTTRDGICIYYDLKANKEICRFYLFQHNNYLIKTDLNYYKCSPDAAKLLHFVTPDLKVIPFEQLDVKYNRPDLVLEAIGNRDTALINSYRKAYRKRIKKLGIDTTAFEEGYSVPEADFAKRNSIEYEQNTDQLNIHITGGDSHYNLDRLNVWVNEIPLYGQRGINIRQRNTNQIDTTITLQLSYGENRIETSVLNVNGTESYRMPLYVKYTPEKTPPQKVYFIGLGVEKFDNPAYNLQYSVNDIRQLARRFRQRYGDTLEIDTLMNEEVTLNSITALKQKLLKSNVNDRVILAFSGHGLLSKEYDYYLGTSNVDFTHPETNGLPYEALENLLDSIPARQKLMLLDACHSGEVDKDDEVHIAAAANRMGLIRGAAVGNDDTTGTRRLGLSNSFELMQELFVNVSKGTGATVISASAGTQFALERGDLKNGVFTYSILEAMMNNPSMYVSQLKNTVEKKVSDLTEGMQKPTSRNQTLYYDWRVW